jgi:hypothetical protein
MTRLIALIVGAALAVAPGAANAIWDQMDPPSGPLMMVTIVHDAGGDSEPVFGAPTTAHDNAAADRVSTLVATGDSADVIVHAFEGRRGTPPTAVAAAPRPGGG